MTKLNDWTERAGNVALFGMLATLVLSVAVLFTPYF
jgi:hypothetical protein